MSLTFAGKNVLVTGGGRGVGKGIIQRLVDEGASVYTIEKDPQLAENLRKEFPNVKVQIGDVSKWTEVQKQIEEFGVAMDHLINNAAFAAFEPFLEVTDEGFDKIFSVNIKALFGVTQAVAKGMIKEGKKGCTIVNIASLTGVMVCSPVMSVYSASKAAVIMLTKSLAVELGQHGIRVNSISPTAINSPMHMEFLESQGNEKKDRLYEIPLKGRSYAMEVEEVINSIIFLMSSQSSMINGHNLVVDGGTTIC